MCPAQRARHRVRGFDPKSLRICRSMLGDLRSRSCALACLNRRRRSYVDQGMKLSFLSALALTALAASSLAACGGVVVVDPHPHPVIVDSDGDGLSDSDE